MLESGEVGFQIEFRELDFTLGGINSGIYLYSYSYNRASRSISSPLFLSSYHNSESIPFQDAILRVLALS